MPRLTAVAACAGVLFAPALAAQQRDSVHVDSAAILPEIIVTTPTRTAQSTGSLAQRVEVLVRADLDRRQAFTVDEAFRDRPGVTLTGDARFGQESRLALRGMTSGYGTQRTLVMLDGRPLTDEYLGHVDLALYPLFAMSRVEMVRGPASAAYGTNAMGGVVNMLPSAGTARPATDVQLEGGNFGTGGGVLAHRRIIGAVDVAATGYYRQTNGYLANSSGQMMDWSLAGGLARVGWSGQSASVRGYTMISDGQGVDEGLTRDALRFSQDVVSDIAVDRSRGAMLRVQGYYSHLDQDFGWFDRPASNYKQHSFGGIATQSLRVGSHALLVGGEFRQQVASVIDAAGNVDASATTWSLFAQDEVQVGEKLTLLGGLRGDHVPENGMTVTWRAGASYRVSPGGRIYIAGGTAFRAPALSDRFLPPTSYFGLTFEGNPGLGPEKLTSVEVGADYEIVRGVWAAASGFITRANGFWDFLPGEDGVFRPENIAKVGVDGVELEARVRAGRSFTVGGGLSLIDARYMSFIGREDVEGNRIDDNVLTQGQASVEWQHPRGHQLVGLMKVSGDRVTDPENSTEGLLPGYTLLDLMGRFVVTRGLALTLSARNILDVEYSMRPEYPQPGRQVIAGAQLTF